MTPVSILTGFLGSGKTTLLAAMLRRSEFAGTAVIMNEFGEIGLDHHLIEAGDEDMVVLSTGCLCCAARGDLARAMTDLFARREAGLVAFNRVVVETTGMADPAPIVQGFMVDLALSGRARLGRIVATADALVGAATLADRPEARRQAAFADRIVVTKVDLAGEAKAAALAAKLAAVNPEAEISMAAMGAIDPSILLPDLDAPARDLWLERAPNEGQERHSHGDHEGFGAHGGVASTVLRREAPVRAAALPLFLETLADVFGGKLLRLKGLVHVAEAPERPAVVHGVRHVFHPLDWLDAWPTTVPPETRLTFIGEDIAPDWLDVLLDMLDEEAGLAAP